MAAPSQSPIPRSAATHWGRTLPAQGAGVYSTGGILTVTDTTITGNTGTGQLQGSGVFLDTGASATITDATITGNTTTATTTGGAGIFDRGSLTLGGTIVAANANNGTTDNCRLPLRLPCFRCPSAAAWERRLQPDR